MVKVEFARAAAVVKDASWASPILRCLQMGQPPPLGDSRPQYAKLTLTYCTNFQCKCRFNDSWSMLLSMKWQRRGDEDIGFQFLTGNNPSLGVHPTGWLENRSVLSLQSTPRQKDCGWFSCSVVFGDVLTD